MFSSTIPRFPSSSHLNEAPFTADGRHLLQRLIDAASLTRGSRDGIDHSRPLPHVVPALSLGGHVRFLAPPWLLAWFVALATGGSRDDRNQQEKYLGGRPTLYSIGVFPLFRSLVKGPLLISRPSHPSSRPIVGSSRGHTTLFPHLQFSRTNHLLRRRGNAEIPPNVKRNMRPFVLSFGRIPSPSPQQSGPPFPPGFAITQQDINTS